MATVPSADPAPRPGDDPALELYHELSGTGRPLVLLHGAFGTIESCFGRLGPQLARHFEVIAVELEGHGRTADRDRPLSYTQMARDTGALIERLGLAPAHVVGYSMGGAVGMELALTQPHLVDRLVQFGGVSFSPTGNNAGAHDSNGYHAEPPPQPNTAETATALNPHAGAAKAEHVNALIAQLEGSRWHRAYLDVAPDPSAWPRLVAKVAAVDDDFGWTPAEIGSLARPTLLINGDADVTTLEHIVEMFRILGGGDPGDDKPATPHRLAILPGATHVGMLDQADLLDVIIRDFLQDGRATGEPAEPARP